MQKKDILSDWKNHKIKLEHSPGFNNNLMLYTIKNHAFFWGDLRIPWSAGIFTKHKKFEELKDLICKYIIINETFGSKELLALEEMNCLVDSTCYKKYQNLIKVDMEKTARKRANEKLWLIRNNKIKNKGVLIIQSAGNDGVKTKPALKITDTNDIYESDITTNPSAMLIVAAGCDSHDNNKYNKLCIFSNYGKSYIDVLAPGKDIPVILASSDNEAEASATFVEGTSFATPIISGIASLIVQCKPSMSALEIKNSILSGATHINIDLLEEINGGRVLNNDLENFIDSLCFPNPAPNSIPSEEKKPIIHDDL